MRILYHLGILGFSFILHLAALFGHRKATLWIEGRKDWKIRLTEKFKGVSSCIWIHCASLGEYELSVPLIKEIKKSNPSQHLLITFFSPSGFEVKKNESSVFHVAYLPIDSAANARDLIDIIRPELVFFAKYDYWFHYLNELKAQSIPTYVFSASFRPSQVFFKSYGAWYKTMLLNFTALFVIEEASKKLLQSVGIHNVIVAGDTRYDRVSDTAHANRDIPFIENFKSNNHLIISGSTWAEDEDVLIPFINQLLPNLKFIIAPHEIEESHLQGIEKKLTVPSVRYSTLSSDSIVSNITVIIIDNIGMLSALYKYGDIAYIGGAFKQGLHNILEPLSFGLPVVFGPHYKRFPEAISFIEAEGAFSISDTNTLSLKIKEISAPNVLENIKKSNSTLIAQHIGATKKITQSIQWQN